MAVTVLHGHDQSGPTANRPTNAEDGFGFFDTTLGCMIYYDATNSVWRDSLGRNVAGGIFNLSGAGAPTDGSTGTGVGVAATGCRYINTTTGTEYVNIGDADSPSWSADALDT